MRTTSIVSSKGQIVIPAALRRKYRLKEGVTVVFEENGDGSLTLAPKNYDSFLSLGGSLAHLPLQETLREFKEEEMREENG